MSDLSISEYSDGELVVDSRLIAERLGIQHESFMKTVDTYETVVTEAFGGLRFEIGVPDKPTGNPPKYVLLTEDQATLLMTFSRNTPQVVQCKVDLVASFSKAREALKRKQYIPYWYERMRVALSDSQNPLQIGYFCIYREMMDFFCELENRFGYVLADLDPKTGKRLIPDISIGLRFNRFLQSDDEMPSQARVEFLGSSEKVDFRQPGPRKNGWFNGGKDFDQIRMYNHVYPKSSHGEYNVQPVMSYPEEYREIFRYYLQEYWIPDFFVPYIVDRDSEGLRQIQSRMSQISSFERRMLSTTLVGKLLPSLPKSA